MIINNEHKLGRAVDRLLKSEISYNYAHCTWRLRLTMLAFHIIHAPAEARSRDLLVPRPAFYHWAMAPVLPVRFLQILFSVEVEKWLGQSEARAAILVFRSKNTRVVEDLDFLLPIGFRSAVSHVNFRENKNMKVHDERATDGQHVITIFCLGALKLYGEGTMNC